MSMFISDLAFEDTAFSEIAKVGIITASILSAITGMLYLSFTLSKKSQRVKK